MFQPILGWILWMGSVSHSFTFHDRFIVGTEKLLRAVWIMQLIVLDTLLYLKNNVYKESICSLRDNKYVSYINGIPMVFNTEEPRRLQSMGSLRVGHDWETSLSLFTFMHWRRKWQPTPVFLPGEFQGQGSLVGCHLWGRTESDMTEVT